MSIDLPISKSIANRLLMLQAIHGDPLMEVSCDMPDDVRLLHDVLHRLSPLTSHLSPLTFQLNNNGTAMRFLTAYCAQLEGCDVTLDGCDRMRERPIRQEVDILRGCGAQIDYLGKEGFPPVHIVGTKLKAPEKGLRLDNPLSTQMVSALLLIGLPVKTNSHSPYISMTKKLIKAYPLSTHKLDGYFPLSTFNFQLERDWSSASYWYEYIAIHGGVLDLPGLSKDSLQGDRVVADLFRPLGIDTIYTNTGVRIARTRAVNPCPRVVNFKNCPDLYPAVKMTYLYFGKPLIAIGTSSLRYKESDRLLAFSPFNFQLLSTFNFQLSTLKSHHDHRIAMSLLAADLPCDDPDCISKSYPHFVEHLNHQSSIINHQYTLIIPRRGINDDNKGKKHALHKLISAATTEYVWLQDDDVTPPLTSHLSPFTSHLSPFTSHLSPLNLPPADLYILPLKMQGDNSLLSRLQVAEYAAIQELTMQTAKRGRAVMCSGANMIVNRNRWLESFEDLHPEIPSGDDMFLLESFRRRGLRIVAIDRPDYTATIAAETSWGRFIRQRMRWAGKAPHYTDLLIRRYGAMVLGANLLQLLCPVVLLIKFPIEYSLIKKRDPEVSFWIALLLEIIYPYYMLLCIVGGLLRRSW